MGLRSQSFQQEERGRGLCFCFVLEEMDGGDEGMARSAQNAVVLVKWGSWLGESKGCGSGEFHGTLP